jgi:ssDNA-binding Zn-finger/Zn-ribbon topoisomerase 1
MTGDTLIVLILLWIACGYIGKKIANQKEAGDTGFWLGVLLGPIGIAIALGLDDRSCCPTCGTRLNARPAQCPQCQTRFKWSNEGKTCEFFPPAGTAPAAAARSAAAHNSNLLPCPDCGNQISRLAQACPKCGRPMNSAHVAPPLPSSPAPTPTIPKPPPLPQPKHP